MTDLSTTETSTKIDVCKCLIRGTDMKKDKKEYADTNIAFLFGQ